VARFYVGHSQLPHTTNSTETHGPRVLVPIGHAGLFFFAFPCDLSTADRCQGGEKRKDNAVLFLFFSRHRALDRRRSDDLILLLACSSHGAFMLDFCVGIKTSGASHRPNAGLVFWPKAPKKCQLFESSFLFIATVPKASQRIRFLFSFDYYYYYYYYYHHYHHSYYRLKAIHERRGICLAMDSRLSFG